MNNKNELVPLTDVCRKLHRPESTIRRYLRDYRDELDTHPKQTTTFLPRLVATQLTLIRDLERARLRHNDIVSILRALNEEQLWPQIQNMRQLLKEKRRDLLRGIKVLGFSPGQAEMASTKTTNQDMRISRDAIIVASVLLTLRSVLDSNKGNADLAKLCDMLDRYARTYNSDTRKLFGLLPEQRKTTEATKKAVSPLRRTPRRLSNKDVKFMLQSRGFYDREKNPNGTGFEHNYDKVRRQGEVLLVDHTAGLTWQQGGSAGSIRALEKAKKYVRELNQTAFAGYTDWRLPTLEEVMSLMEQSAKNKNLHIDPAFERAQQLIWTRDACKDRDSWAWIVDFSHGCCDVKPILGTAYVRAVRS